jgi:hypothetical protein
MDNEEKLFYDEREQSLRATKTKLMLNGALKSSHKKSTKKNKRRKR